MKKIFIYRNIIYKMVKPLCLLGGSPERQTPRAFWAVSIGAGEKTRTSDLLITNQLLYQLSYTSAEPEIIAKRAVRGHQRPGDEAEVRASRAYSKFAVSRA